MNILIILTGGTIGSTTRNGITSPDPAAAETLLKTSVFQQDPAQDPAKCPVGPVHADTLIPYYILSEELDAAHLNLLSKAVSDNLHKKYDGILITHGSDTLPYAAALLDLMFWDAPVPIVLVCSNYPLSDPRANGAANLRTALSFLSRSPAGGVYTAYRNDPQRPDTPVLIHRGTELTRQAESSGDLHSVSTGPQTPAGRVLLCAHPGILQISCAPGVLYPEMPARTASVILLPYHSGTLPVNDPSFAAFCSTCRNREIPLLLPAAGCETCYSSTSAFKGLGITPVPLTSVGLYARLWIDLSQTQN